MFFWGILLSDGTKLFADMIVFATGFDAMTGALQKMNIRGKKGLDCGKPGILGHKHTWA